MASSEKKYKLQLISASRIEINI